MPTFREEVVNVQLAEALVARGFDAHPETVTRKRELPDVIVNLGGLKVVLEGRVESLLRSLRRDAFKRLAVGLADISIAIGYPKKLMSGSSLAHLRAQIEETRYSGSIFSFAAGAHHEDPFTNINLDELADLINSAFRVVVNNDVVRDQVKRVESMIEGIVETAITSDLFFTSSVLTERLKQALGIPADGKEDSEEID